ncbi:MAG: helicase-associated domain-containing protein [Planctomycetota bacterium JB042]
MSDARGTRAPSLELLLRERTRDELSEYYSFWNGHQPAPRTSDALVESLVSRMTDEESVRKRLKFLSKKLVDLLKFLLRDSAFTVTRENVLNSRLFNYMSQYEVEAALNALQKRGFVFQLPEGANKKRELAFAVPGDLGDVLSAFLWDEECQLADLFSLRSWLKRQGNLDLEDVGARLVRPSPPKDADEAIQRLCPPAEIAHRIRALDDEMQAVVALVAGEAGGFCPKGLYDRLRDGEIKWDRRRIKVALESSHLGTVRHLALGEYGINHFDDTILLFDEVVAAWRREVGPDPAHDVDDVRTCGVDLISDISNFLSFVSHNRVRLTLNGQIYRTVTKKLTEQFILSKKAEFAGFDSFQYIYDFCVGKKLVERRDDRTLHITVKGRKWEKDPLERKLKILLDHAYREPLSDGDMFHAPKLRDQLLEVLGTQQVGTFLAGKALPAQARNAYLARLEEDHVRDAFQNRYQYAPTAVMRDAAGLAQSLFHWMKERLYLLGVIDLAFKGEAPVAVRLTPLGARALGRSIPADLVAQGRPLMVNPDFEVLLFPEQGDTYDLITKLDRFAERTSSDSVYRYKVTASSIEKAVAEGIDVSEILRLLSENARGAIPQNVVYSVKEWAGHVRFVTARRMVVLRGKNREIMDRVLRTLSARNVGSERLSPTAIVVEESADLKEVEGDLSTDGVFLEGLAQPNGNGHAKAAEGDEEEDGDDGLDPSDDGGSE